MESVFLAMVFSAVALLSFSMVVPVFGEASNTRKKLSRRLREVANDNQRAETVRLLRERHLKQLSPFERWLENLPGMKRLEDILRQAGHQTFAYRFLLLLFLIALVALIAAFLFLQNILWATAVAAGAVILPVVKLLYDREQRVAKFEEQLPDAIDIMKRAMQAGHPFTETLNLVGEEITGPVGQEFATTFNDLNYGSDLRSALLGFLERMPTVTVMALVTSILVQKESGGNLAEIFGKISAVIRGRFRFHRRVKTLSAEGRLSGWILTLLPFVLFAVISATTPSYLPMLTEDPQGKELIMWAFGLMLVGILWMRKIIKIEV
ncbi:MAG: type II secretion system F family protein [Pseudomonadales bacterium]